MDAASPPADPAEARRRQILQAAVAIFGERGFQRATIKEIAGRAGVAPGTIYLYFKNKRQLLVAIVDELVTQSVDDLLAHAISLDAEAFIAAVLRDRLQFARRNAALVQALVTELWTDRELQEIFVTRVIQPVLALAGRYAAQQVETGKLRPFRGDVVLPAVVGGVAAVSFLRPNHILSDQYREDELVDELTRLFLYGLQPQPEGQCKEGQP